MSKTYILEPTTLEFRSQDQHTVIADLTNTDLATKTMTELETLIPAGTTVEFNREKYISAGYSNVLGQITATKTGEMPDFNGDPVSMVMFAGYSAGEVEVFAMIAYDSGEETGTNPGTYTVSIYTETEDDTTPKYPVKNTTYELHGHNEVERIRYKLKKKAEQGSDESGSESSGGAGVFMVGVDFDGDSTFTLDKTWTEIDDAASSGKLVVIKRSDLILYEYVVGIYSSDGSCFVEAFNGVDTLVYSASSSDSKPSITGGSE